MIRLSSRKGEFLFLIALLKLDSADIRCNITEDGKAALLRLSKGDMRRALNVLQASLVYLFPSVTSSSSSWLCWSRSFDADSQACHAAYDRIDETAVYTCTGNPQPKDIERVVQSMMSDEFGTSYSRESNSAILHSSTQILPRILLPTLI